MRRPHFAVIFAGSVLAALLLPRAAVAQPSPPGEALDAVSEKEARARFNSGNDHFDKGEYREAYDEFRKSLAAKKTRAAMAAAASTLKQLGRYDEALTLYEDLCRDFPTLSPSLQAKVALAMAELQGLVGTLKLAGDAPPGAAVFVDDQLRGRTPLPGPLRVAVGSHAVRLEKEGFAPITGAAEVSAGAESVAELRAPQKKGRLEVREKHNWALPVSLDGNNVGVTPWDGLVDLGEHTVRVHGFVDADALSRCEAPEATPSASLEAAIDGAEMGSATATTRIRLYEAERLTLDAEELDASLRVESTPPGASLRIDGRPAGRTPWERRLRLGEHTIEVSDDGFLTATKSVRLVRRKQSEVQIQLERRRDDSGVRAARIAGMGVAYGLGAAGLGLFFVAGDLALQKVNGLEDRCPQQSCYRRDNAEVEAARALGTAATVGLVVGGVGAAAGTVVFFAVRPSASEKQATARAATTAGLHLRADLGPGRLTISGEF